MKVSLYTKCLSCNFKKLFELKGYAWFDKGVYNLNIIGIRRANKNKVTNTYDDVLVMDYNTDCGHKRNVYNITTSNHCYEYS